MTNFFDTGCYNHIYKGGEQLEQVIYADVLFLIDLSMDFLSLYITASLLRIRFKSVNTVFAAVIGAVFSVLSVINKSEALLLTFAVSVVMCIVAYFGCSFKVVAKTVAVFYAVNMLLGGAMTALFNLFNLITDGKKDLLIYGELNTVSDNMPFAVFVIGVAFITVAFKVISGIFSNRSAKRCIQLLLTFGNKTEKLNAYEDSGNLLCEPLSGEPVIFLKEDAIKKVAGDRIISGLKMGKEYLSGTERQKYRLVVYHTVNGSDMCACIKPDKLVIDGKVCSAWIAIGKNLNVSEGDGIVPSSVLR